MNLLPVSRRHRERILTYAIAQLWARIGSMQHQVADLSAPRSMFASMDESRA